MMNFLRKMSPLIWNFARFGGGVILFITLLFGIMSGYHDVVEIWIAFGISILMILVGWMIPSSGSQRKDARSASGGGGAAS